MLFTQAKEDEKQQEEAEMDLQAVKLSPACS